MSKKYYPFAMVTVFLVAFLANQQGMPSQTDLRKATNLGVNVKAVQSGNEPVSETKVVMLGTGNPKIDPDRSGPATAIIVNNTAYLVDMGPGVVRRAKSAELTKGIGALDPIKLRVVFVTHLHSDHTVGYADLIFTPWTMGRRFPLEVYGPNGMKLMTEHLLKAYSVDIETRTNPEGNQRDFPDGYKVNAHEITAGVIYKDSNVTVTAFKTKHAMESYGYRFDTKDRSIVISGDTNPTDATIEACNGCDILIHEAQTQAWLYTRPFTFQQFAAKYHTTTLQLSELATRAMPGLLILYHYSGLSDEEIFNDMLTHYKGHFVIGRDLDVY
ncbi:MAG: MBL fold metallo-hydrolase [Flavisolibacter sp.]